MNRPMDMSFDESRRLLHVVMMSGAMATLTVYRDEQVSGWTLQETDRLIRSVATVGESTYALVERQAAHSSRCLTKRCNWIVPSRVHPKRRNRSGQARVTSRAGW
jgi:hypothetical protein